MTTARIEIISHRLFLTVPIALIIFASIFFPYASNFWQQTQGLAIAFYVFALVFLHSSNFSTETIQVGEKLATKSTKLRFSFDAWFIGLCLSVGAVFIAAVVHHAVQMSALIDLLLLKI